MAIKLGKHLGQHLLFISSVVGGGAYEAIQFIQKWGSQLFASEWMSIN